MARWPTQGAWQASRVSGDRFKLAKFPPSEISTFTYGRLLWAANMSTARRGTNKRSDGPWHLKASPTQLSAATLVVVMTLSTVTPVAGGALVIAKNPLAVGVGQSLLRTEAGVPSTLASADYVSGGPAPMGVVDYGTNPLTGDYNYTAQGFNGSVVVDGLNVSPNSTGMDGGHQVSLGNQSSFQLNVILPVVEQFPGPGGGELISTYWFWVQDVVEIVPWHSGSNGTRILSFEDAIFNFGGNHSLEGISGNGGDSSYDGTEFYGDTVNTNNCAGDTFSLAYGSKINLIVTMSYPPSPPGGYAFAVNFEYQSGGASAPVCLFDTAYFEDPWAHASWSTNGFEVNGSATDQDDEVDDAEMVWCGAGDGAVAYVENAQLQMALRYLNATGGWNNVPSSSNHGYDTAETVSGVFVGNNSEGNMVDTTHPYWINVTGGSEANVFHFLYTSVFGTGSSVTSKSIVGGNVSASGSRFAPDHEVSFWLWNEIGEIYFTSSTLLPSTTCVTNNDGAYSDCRFTVPPEINQTYQVIASTGMATGLANLTISPSLLLSESSGSNRSTIFAIGEGLSDEFLGTYLDFCPSGHGTCGILNFTTETDPNGTWVAQVKIPHTAPIGNNSLELNGSGSSTILASAPFRIPGPTLSATQTGHHFYTRFYSEDVNVSVVASGVGFRPGSPMSFSSSASPYSYLGGTPSTTLLSPCDANRFGSFANCTLNITAYGVNPATYLILTITVHDDQNEYALMYANVTVGSDPTGVAFDPISGYIYVTNSGSNTISVISNATLLVVDTISVGLCPSAIVFDPADSNMYVANKCGNSVDVVNTTFNVVVGIIDVGDGPSAITINSVQGDIYVADSSANEVSVISTTGEDVVATVAVGTDPTGLVYDSGDSDLFVANTNSGTISVISGATDSIISTITVGGSPASMAYDPNQGEVVATDLTTGLLHVLNDTRLELVASIFVAPEPGGIEYDAAEGVFLVTGFSEGVLYVVNATTDTVSGMLNTGAGPSGVAASGATFAVANSGSSSITIGGWLYSASCTVYAYGAV